MPITKKQIQKMEYNTMVDGVNGGNKPQYTKLDSGHKINLNKLDGLRVTDNNKSIFGKGKVDVNGDGKIDKNETFDLNGDGVISGNDETSLLRKYLDALDGRDGKASAKDFKNVNTEMRRAQYEALQNIAAQHEVLNSKNQVYSDTINGKEFKIETDADGNVTETLPCKYAYGTQTLTKRADGTSTITTTYNNDDACVTAGVVGHTQVVERNAKGHKVSSILYKPDGAISETATFEYDTNGNLMSENICDSDGILTEKITYTYDESGNNLTENHEYYNDDGSFDSKTESKYDEKGNKIEYKYYSDSSNGEKIPYSVETYTYGENGTKIGEVRTEYDKNDDGTYTKTVITKDLTKDPAVETKSDPVTVTLDESGNEVEGAKKKDEENPAVEEEAPKTYEIKRGDTLEKIARRHLRDQLGTEPTAKQVYEYYNQIAEANGIDNVNKIYAGKSLTLPDIQSE